MRIILMAVCAMLLTSCASTTTQVTKAGYVQILSSGAILVNGRDVPVNEVGRVLKSRGFGPRSTIKIHIAEDTSPRIMKMVKVSLAGSGFRRVFFIKPQQVDVILAPMK